MKRSGRVLLCLACAMALSAVTQAANGPSPAVPTGPRPNAIPAGEMAHRLELLKKKLHQRNPALKIEMPGSPVPAPAAPASTVPRPRPAPAADSVSADMQGNPYASIPTRNVFGLNPLPPPDANQPPPGPPPPKITLTGITTIFGPAEALYKVAGIPQAGKPPKDESYILEEGQGQDDVTVEHIDVAKGMVTFNNHGVIQDIPLVAGTASGGETGSGGGFQPPRPGGFGGRPSFNNALQNFRQRLQQQRMGNQNGYNNSAGQNSSYNGLSGDDAAALIAAQHAQLQNQGNPMASIFPPTAYDQQAQDDANGSDSGGTGGQSTPPVRGPNGLFRPTLTGASGPAP